jgi:hypothetical protein
MSYKIIERYNNMKPKTIEIELKYRDSDINDDIICIEHINNLSFKSSFYFKHLIDQNKFSIRKMRTKTIQQVLNELDNLCLTIKNHQFELTKLFDFEFTSSYEKKIVNSFLLSDDIFYSKIDSVTNRYYGFYLSRKDDIINYYNNKRLKFQRKSKMLKIENYIHEN